MMITQSIKGKSKIYKPLIKSKIFKKSKKEKKTKLHTIIIQNITRITKKALSLRKMQAITVKIDLEKEGESPIKDCRNYRIMMESKTCIMNLRIMIGIFRTIISIIESILTMIIKLLMIIRVNHTNSLKTITI